MENRFVRKIEDAKESYLKIAVLDDILNRSDSSKIIKEIFPELSKKIYFRSLASRLFNYLLVYNVNFHDEILYLFSNGYIKRKKLTAPEIEIILYNCDGGIDEVIKNLHLLNLEDQKLIASITNYVVNRKKEKFFDLINAIIKTHSWDAITYFFIELISEDENFDYNLILDTLRRSKTEDKQSVFSTLPHTLAEHMIRSTKLRDFLVLNFEELFDYEKNKKMSFYQAMRRYLPERIRSKYDYLSKIYLESTVPPAIEKSLNILLEHKEEDFIKDYVGNNEVKFKGIGTTSQVFRVGQNKILKISQRKHNKDTITEHFLLAPTKMKVIYNENNQPILYVEKQNLLLQKYNGIEINSEDLDNYFMELERCDLVLRDPHCIKREFDNFGFLRDYHDATLVGVNSYDELPEWFKKRPVVLFDIDMVTKKVVIKKRKL